VTTPLVWACDGILRSRVRHPEAMSLIGVGHVTERLDAPMKRSG